MVFYTAPAGTYCPENGTSQPLPCPLGQSSSPGQALCHRCNDSSPRCGGAVAAPPPWTNTARRSGQALVCRPGTYKDPRGGPACLVCPLGEDFVSMHSVLCRVNTSAHTTSRLEIDGVPVQTGCRASPRWVLHTGSGWGVIPPPTHTRTHTYTLYGVLKSAM